MLPCPADFTVKQQRECQALVKAADKAGERFDFVLYGDSVLRVIARGSKAEWKRLFPPAKGWHAVPLGVSGNDIEVGSGFVCSTAGIVGGGWALRACPRLWKVLLQVHATWSAAQGGPTSLAKRCDALPSMASDNTCPLVALLFHSTLGRQGRTNLNTKSLLCMPCPQDVAWRLMTKAEVPKKAPKVVGLLVGTNNLRAHQSSAHIASLMDYLLGWMQVGWGWAAALRHWAVRVMSGSGELLWEGCSQPHVALCLALYSFRAGWAHLCTLQLEAAAIRRACPVAAHFCHPLPPSAPFPLPPAQTQQAAFPESKILVLNLLPRTSPHVGPVNTKLKALCDRRGIHWSTCGSDIDPRDPKQLYDGTHPAPKGADKVLRCLAPEVARLAGKA